MSTERPIASLVSLLGYLITCALFGLLLWVALGSP